MPRHPKHLPAEERRAATVDAFIELAAEGNPGDITTTQLARRMGVTQGALFRHFPGKEAILEAVMQAIATRLLARTERAAAAAPSAAAALEAIFHAHVAFIAEHPGIPRMLFGELQHNKATAPKRLAQALMGRYGQQLRELLERGKAQGEMAPDLDCAAAAILFIGTIQGLVMQSLLADDLARLESDAPGVFAIFLRGIGGNA